MKPYGGRRLTQGDVDVLEGSWSGAVLLIEFPSHADAVNWYNSPECRAIRFLRINNAISEIFLCDSVSPDFTVAGFPQQTRAAIAAASGTERRGRGCSRSRRSDRRPP